jgi:hypothetical protein
VEIILTHYRLGSRNAVLANRRFECGRGQTSECLRHLSLPIRTRDQVGGECKQGILGIFRSRAAAAEAVQGLLANRISPQSIILLSGEAGKAQLDTLPTDDSERDGMGGAVGAVVGGAMGTGAGLSIGSAVASLLVPGVGTIFAIGLGAAALLGIGGAAAGASAGRASQDAADIGVPKDDTLCYRDLLKRGRSLVVATVESRDEVSAVKAVFERQGSEDVEIARKEAQSAA